MAQSPVPAGFRPGLTRHRQAPLREPGHHELAGRAAASQSSRKSLPAPMPYLGSAPMGSVTAAFATAWPGRPAAVVPPGSREHIPARGAMPPFRVAHGQLAALPQNGWLMMRICGES
jgi:hypothetical protein